VPAAQLVEVDKELIERAYSTLAKIREEIAKQSLHSVIEVIVALGAAANEYIDHQAPWSLRKTDQGRMETVLYTLLECIRVIGILLQPIIPDSAAKILKLLNVKENDFAAIGADNAMKSGDNLPAPEIVFPRIV
jgi:methionyl-tRNA synthetase